MRASMGLNYTHPTERLYASDIDKEIQVVASQSLMLSPTMGNHSSTRTLQMGHSPLVCSQRSTQPVWKLWKHGRVRCWSPSLKSSMHPMQERRSSGRTEISAADSLCVGKATIALRGAGTIRFCIS